MNEGLPKLYKHAVESSSAVNPRMYMTMVDDHPRCVIAELSEYAKGWHVQWAGAYRSVPPSDIEGLASPWRFEECFRGGRGGYMVRETARACRYAEERVRKFPCLAQLEMVIAEQACRVCLQVKAPGDVPDRVKSKLRECYRNYDRYYVAWAPQEWGAGDRDRMLFAERGRQYYQLVVF